MFQNDVEIHQRIIEDSELSSYFDLKLYLLDLKEDYEGCIHLFFQKTKNQI